MAAVPLIAGLIAGLGGLCYSPAAAMPIHDYTAFTYRLYEYWLPGRVSGLAGFHITGPALDPILDFQNEPVRQTVFTLEQGHNDAQPAVQGDDFFRRLSNRDLIQADAGRKPLLDRSDVDIAIDLESFTREAMSNSFTRTAERLGSELGLAEPSAGTPQPPQLLTPAQPPPGGDVPLLSALQLGTMAVEVMGPELQQVELFGHSLMELNELRKYMLISEPVSGNIMMMDAQPQRALVVNNTFGNDQRLPLGTAQQAGDGKPARPSFMEKPTLLQMLTDYVTSSVAMVIYGLLILIWMTWRYLLRKYV